MCTLDSVLQDFDQRFRMVDQIAIVVHSRKVLHHTHPYWICFYWSNSRGRQPSNNSPCWIDARLGLSPSLLRRSQSGDPFNAEPSTLTGSNPVGSPWWCAFVLSYCLVSSPSGALGAATPTATPSTPDRLLPRLLHLRRPSEVTSPLRPP